MDEWIEDVVDFSDLNINSQQTSVVPTENIHSILFFEIKHKTMSRIPTQLA